MVDIACGFCAEINKISCKNNLFTNLISKNCDIKTRVLIETKHFIVIPTIGCFVEGYLLIVSKEHYSCLGNTPPNIVNELNLLISKVKHLLLEHYNKKTVCFEHGSISCSNKFGGCIDHAHLHIVPCNDNLIKIVESFGLESRRISSINDLKKSLILGNPYLYWEDVDENKYIIEHGFIPSQFFRKIVSEYYNVGNEWDWREYHNINNLLNTLEKLKKS